jgi:hypothetical protein
MMDLAFAIGDEIGMTNDAMLWRVLTEVERMQALTENSCINISSLLGLYSARCKEVGQKCR